MAIKISGSTIIDDSRNIVAGVAATFTGNVTVGGTITYEDVTNIDSVGVITARSGIDCNGTLEVSGVTNFDSSVKVSDKIERLGDADTCVRFPGADTFAVETAGSERLRIHSTGQLELKVPDANPCLILTPSGTNAPATINFNTPGTGSAVFKVQGSEKLRITSDGKVGIGTVNPTSLLHLTGSAPRITLTDTAGTDDTGKIFSTGGTLYLQQRDSTSHGNIIFRTENNSTALERFTINSSGVKTIKNGNLNINSTYIDFSGDVSTPATAAAIFRPADNTLAFSTANTERLRIDSSGNVGIGTDDTSLYNNTSGNGIMMRGGQVIDIARSNDLQLTLNRLTADGANIGLYQAGALKGTIGTKSGGIYFGTGGDTERLRITSDGYVQIKYPGSATTGGAPLYVGVTGKSSVTYAGGSDDTACVRIEDEGSSDGYYHGLELRTKNSGDARIYAHDRGDNAVDLVFATDNDSDSPEISEKLRITSGGGVLIGTTSGTQGQLNIKNANDFSTASISTNTDNIFLISDATSGDGVYGASIGFSRVQYADRRSAAIASVQQGSDEDNVGLAFFTHPGANAADPVVEKLRISHDGRLLLGTQRTYGNYSYYDDITINNSDGSGQSGGTGITLISSTNSWNALLFGDSDDNGIGAIKYDHNTNHMRFVVNGIDPALYINSSGQVGIGTDSPNHELTVYGDEPNFRMTHTGSTNRLNSFYTQVDGTGVKFNSYQEVTTTRRPFIFSQYTTEVMRIDGSGRLLVNTTSAMETFGSAALQVATAAGGTLVLGREDSSVTTGNGLGAIYFDTYAGGAWAESAVIAAEADANQSSNDYPSRLVFKTTADGASSVTERLRITSTGNVGVGTASPAQRFTSFAASGYPILANGPSNGIGLGGNGVIVFGTYNLGSYASGAIDASDFVIKTSGTERFKITSTGQLQATSAADVRLTLGSGGTAGTNDSVHVRADSADLKFMAASGGNTIFETNGTENLRIDSSGRVMMGNTQAANMLGAANRLVVGDGGGNQGMTIYSSSSDSGTIAFADGTSDPSYRMGQIIYDHGGNAMSFRTNGNTERLSILSGGGIGIGKSIYHLGDTDTWFGFADNDIFQLKTGGATRIYVDSAGTTWNRNDATGISTTTKLINSATNASGNGVSLAFAPTQNYGTRFSSIDVVQDGNNNMYMAFKVTDANQDPHAVERMRITRTGQLITNGSADPYSTRSATFQPAHTNTNNYISIIAGNTTSISGITFGDAAGQSAGNYAGMFEYYHDGDYLAYKQNNSEKLRINSTGIATFYQGFSLEAGGAVRFDVSHVSGGNVLVKNPTAANITFQTTTNSNQLELHNDGTVGMGIGSPSAKLHVQTSSQDVAIFESTNNAPTGPEIFIRHSPGAGNMQHADTIGMLQFQGVDLANNSTLFSSIRAIAADVTNTEEKGDLTFWTRRHSDFLERLRIKSDGNVGIGTISPENGLHVSDGSNYASPQNSGAGKVMIEHASSADLQFMTANSGYNHIFFGDQDDANIGSIVYHHAGNANAMVFNTNTAEALRIDDSGRILIGHTASLSEGCLLQVARTNDNTVELFGYSANANGARINFTKSRNGTIGTNTIVQDGDTIGELHFRAANGDGQYYRVAAIEAEMDGGVGVSSVPGRLIFSTTPAGATTQTERMRITQGGAIILNKGNPSANSTLVLDKTDAGYAKLEFDSAGSQKAYVELDGSENMVYYGAASVDQVFYAGAYERLRIASDGRLLKGMNASSTLADGFGAAFQIQGTSATSSSISITRNSAAENPPYLTFGKSKGTTVGSNTEVADGDNLGDIDFKGSDGNGDFNLFAKIRASVDGTPGGSDAPGRLSFFTTTDNSISNVERLRITSYGHLLLGGTSSVNDLTENNAGQKGLVIGSTGMGNAGIAIINSTTGTGRIYFGDAVGSSADRHRGYINYYHNDGSNSDYMLFGTAGSQRLRITNAGTFGFNTSTVREILHVHKTTSDEAYLRFTNTTTGTAAGDGFNIGINASEEALIWNKESTNMLFGTAGSTRMQIGSDGWVGVGHTGSNFAFFDVAADSGVVSGSDFTARVLNRNTSGGNGLIIEAGKTDSNTSFRVRNIATSTPAFYVLGGGTVGISSRIEHWGDSDTHFGFGGVFDSVANTFNIVTAGAERFRIGAGGTTRILGTTSVPGNLFVSTNRNTASNNDVLGSLIFGDSEDNKPAFIRGVVDQTYDGTTTDTPVRLEFHTTPNGSGTSAERMRISSGGDVLPGTDSTYDFGSNTVRWRCGYFDKVYGDGSNLTGISAGGFTQDDQANLVAGTGAGAALDADSCFNILIGCTSGAALNEGDHNTFIGGYSGESNTSGGCNIALGYRVFSTNTSGSYNVAIGAEAGKKYNGANGCNVYIGNRAGCGGAGTVDGVNNIIMGVSAGRTIDGGDGNIFMGCYTSKNISSGSYNIILGDQAGCAMTTGSNNIGLGCNALKAGTLTGADNVAIGRNTGLNLTSGIGNVFIGEEAGKNFTTGGYNIVFGGAACLSGTATANNTIIMGSYAGRCITSANDSIALGTYALGSNGGSALEGDLNIAIGCQAGGCITTGGCSITMGLRAGKGITTGNQNIFLGKYSGMASAGITGSDNVVIGTNAGCSMTSGTTNVFIGKCAGKNATTGSKNIAIGICALHDGVVTGEQNIVMGCDAGGAISSGSYNLLFGRDAARGMTTASNNMAFGTGTLGGDLNAVTTGTGNIVMGNLSAVGATSANYNVIMGHNAGRCIVEGDYNQLFGAYAAQRNRGSHNFASGYLALAGTATAADNTGSYNAALGHQAGYCLSSGNRNVMIGCNSAKCITTASQNVMIGSGAGKCVTTGGYSVFVGGYAAYKTTTATYITAVGWCAGCGATAGGKSTFIGYYGGSNPEYSCNSIGIGFKNGPGVSPKCSTQDIFIGTNAGNCLSTSCNNIIMGHGHEGAHLVADGAHQLSIGIGANYWIHGNASFHLNTRTILPQTNATYELGSSSYRWANIYTEDLELSNKSKKDTGGNDIDGTWGDWTLQEGETEIFMINNRTGKKFKINMTEVE